MVASGTQGWVAGVFLKPMTDGLGWTRQEYSLVQTVGTVVSGVLGFLIGGLIDARGPRRLMLVGGLILAASLAATSQVEELWQFYLIRGIAQTTGNTLVGNLVVNVTVSKWFVARRGMAIAAASSGLSLGGVVMIPLTGWWVGDFGWRAGWLMLAVLSVVVVFPAALIMRRSPEDHGLMPDGMSREEALRFSETRGRVSAATEVQWRRPEAARTAAIWLIILAYGGSQLGQAAAVVHSFPLLTDNGFARGYAGLLFSAQAWAALLSKPLWAMLLERFHPRPLSAISFIAIGVATVAILLAAEHAAAPLVFAAFALYGLSVGGNAPLQETVWASYFGRMHLGQIRALAMPFTILFAASGPFLAGWLYDRSGNYSAAYIIFALFSLASCGVILLARPPRHPQGHRDPGPAGGRE